jgi:hypothetical protein
MVVISLLLVAVAGNTAQTLVNSQRFGQPGSFYNAILQEIASAAVWLSVLPVIIWAFRNLTPFHPLAPVRLFLHICLIPAVSLTHFVMTRILLVVVYAATGKVYDFHFDWSYFANDLSKDVLNYLLFGLIYLGAERLLAPRAAAVRTETPTAACPMIEVRDGMRMTYVAAADLLWAEAAGNYVELHLASGRTLLMRVTLASLVARLEGAGFLRVHRSRIVNMAGVDALENLPGGDAILRLNNGAQIAVSRSYRTDVSKTLGRQAARIRPFGDSDDRPAAANKLQNLNVPRA